MQNDTKNKTPDELKTGIKMERSCTDAFMCLIFTVFFMGMFATAAYGYAHGDPSRLITPFDSSGTILKIYPSRKQVWLNRRNWC